MIRIMRDAKKGRDDADCDDNDDDDDGFMNPSVPRSYIQPSRVQKDALGKMDR